MCFWASTPTCFVNELSFESSNFDFFFNVTTSFILLTLFLCVFCKGFSYDNLFRSSEFYALFV